MTSRVVPDRTKFELNDAFQTLILSDPYLKQKFEKNTKNWLKKESKTRIKFLKIEECWQ